MAGALHLTARSRFGRSIALFQIAHASATSAIRDTLGGILYHA